MAIKIRVVKKQKQNIIHNEMISYQFRWLLFPELGLSSLFYDSAFFRQSVLEIQTQFLGTSWQTDVCLPVGQGHPYWESCTREAVQECGSFLPKALLIFLQKPSFMICSL